MKEQQRYNKIEAYLLNIIVVLLPFLVVGFILFLNGYKLRFSILLPAWNDEVGWWNQVNTMIQYGKPFGYYGYNGTHAAIGKWAAWGGTPLLPYFLFGKIFGWNLYSMALANMTFLSISLFIFLILTKPDKKQKVWLIGTYICLTIAIGYSMTSMSEGLRYSLGIILTALLIWLEQKSQKKNQKFSGKDFFITIIIIIIVYYAITVYLIFSLVVPLFCWFFFRKKKFLLRAGISFIITGLTTVSANHFVSLTSSPYTTSTISQIIQTIKDKGWYQGICYVLDLFFNNLATVDFPNLLNGDTILFWFFSFYLLFLCYLTVVLLRLLKNIDKTDCFTGNKNYYILALWVTAGFLFGYCMLYTGSKWTLCRGINTGLIMALLFLIFVENRIDKKGFILISLLSIVSIWGYYSQIVDERASIAQYTDTILAEKKQMEEVIEISKDNSVWENTVAHYGTVNFMYLTLPAGCGLNYMIAGKENKNAKYALITVGDKNQETYKQMLLDTGHNIIYEDEFFIVLLNSNFR